MRILVTGSRGFIGQHVVRELRERKHKVDTFDIKDGRQDVRNDDDVRKAFEWEPQVVVHLAAQASVQEGLKAPSWTYGVNVVGTSRIADAAVECGARVVFASSGGCVYGSVGWEPCAVGSRLRPIEPYGLSKVMAEKVLQMSGVGCSILRLGNVYGPGDKRGVIAKIIEQGDDFVINGDGRQTRDYVWVGDVVDSIANAAELESLNGVYNVGTGRETSVLQLCALLGVRVQIPMEGTALPRGEVARNWLEPSRELLDGRQWTTLEDGLDSW